MPNEYLDPTGIGTRGDTWSKVGAAATKYEAVEWNSGQTSYIQSSVDTNEQHFTIDGTTDRISAVNTLSVWSNGYTANSPKFVNFQTWDGSTEHTVAVQWTGTPTDREADHTSKTTWTDDMINGAGFEFGIKNASGSANYAYELWLEVDYEYDGGACSGLFNWIPPLIAVGHLFGSNLLSEDIKVWSFLGSYFRSRGVKLFPSRHVGWERELFLKTLARPVYGV